MFSKALQCRALGDKKCKLSGKSCSEPVPDPIVELDDLRVAIGSSAFRLREALMIRHRSVLEYARFRYLKVALLLCLACAALYFWHQPPIRSYGGYGGTWLGYTLGTIGALMILWLTWLGVRKRRYTSRVGTVQGWLSAHVYLGLALVVVATLHTGFEFGYNIHTLAYLIMVAVVVSGIYGVFIYSRVPAAMTDNMGALSMDGVIRQIADLDDQAWRGALSLPDDALAVVKQSIEGSRLGGSFWRILSGRDAKCPTARAVRYLPELTNRLRGESANRNHAVYIIVLKKHELLQRARKDMRYKALMDLWLYVHVPLAVALLVALAAHVVSVFVYW